jgi:multidrug efflux pump subunit AcrA (membrane-fusion protein)
VLFGGVPPYRELGVGVPDGPDVLQLQENLVALGYLKGKASSRFTAAVEAAVKRWQKARHVDQSGRLQPGDAVVLSGPVRVEAVTARLGAPAEGDLLTATGTDRLVTADLDETERPYATVGLRVQVRLADGRSVPGVVRGLADKTSDQKASGVTVTVALDDPGSAPDAGPVTVTLPGERRADVLVVGVRALLALRDGGYAVEAVTDNGSRQQIPVRLGMFANGLVEISGAGLRAGLKVVTTT